MVAMLFAGFAVCGLVLGGVFVGLRIVRVLSEQFDELMPQRMVDFAGFVPGATRED
jgi:hypothetical protein